MKRQWSSTHLLRFVMLVGVLVFVLAPTAAFAQTDGGSDAYPTTPSEPTTVPKSSTSITVGGASASRSSSLPFTGGDVALLAGLGTVVLVSGVAIVMFSKRRSTSTAP
jgi:hypothetical protein